MASVLVGVFLLILSTQSVSSLSILASNTVDVDSSFTVTCSADAMGVVTTPTDNYDKISAVQISWQGYDSRYATQVAFLSGLRYVLNDPNWKDTTLPTGKSSWQVTFPTDADMRSSNFQRSTMKISLTIPKATCDDSGYFWCQINNPDDQPVENNQTMDVTVGTSAFTMVVSPDYSGAGNTYQANQTIIISCAADRLEDNEFYWSRRCPDTSGNVNPSFQSNIFLPWPVTNEKTEHKKEAIANNGCGAMRHSQDLVFKITKEVDGCVVKCEFGSGSGSSTNLQGNATFFMERGVGVSSLSILASNTVDVDSSFTVTCSADAMGVVTTPTENYDRISAVRLSWQGYDSRHVTQVAFLSGFRYVLGDPNWKDTTLPPGKSSWQVTYPTDADMGSSNLERSTMKIYLTVPKATCDDSGYFVCQINNPDDQPVENNQTMNVTVGNSAFSMVVSPDYSAAGNTYKADQTITISCAADGMEDNNFYWTRRCPYKSGNLNPYFRSNVFQAWPIKNQMGEHKIEAIPGNDCGAMRHSQDLVFKITKELDGCVVKCEFGSGSGSSTNLQGNATFFMERDFGGSWMHILDSDTVDVGSRFTVTCSADAIGPWTSAFDRISAVRIYWQAYDSNSLTPIALFSGRLYEVNDVDWKETTLPQDKSSWRVTYPSQADMRYSNFQRSTMKISIIVSNATYEDSGRFYCQIYNMHDRTMVESQTINVTDSVSDNGVTSQFGIHILMMLFTNLVAVLMTLN